MTWPANRILTTLFTHGTVLTAERLASETGIVIDQVWKSCETLVNRRLAERPQRGHYTITPAGITAIASGKEVKCGPQSPTGPRIKSGTFRQRLWKAIRMDNKNTVGGWLQLIGEDDSKATINAQKYICALCSAGYMIRLPGKQRGTAVTSSGYNRYLLATNSGPLAPMVRRIERALYDPNTKESVKFREVPL